jgi:sporulation protein YlmC with PRC-barrel domain
MMILGWRASDLVIQLENGTVIKTFVKGDTMYMAWRHKEKGTIQVPVRRLEPKRDAAPIANPKA